MKHETTSDQKLAKIQSKVFDKLILHLQKRTDVQNIDLMDLAGFCRKINRAQPTAKKYN